MHAGGLRVDVTAGFGPGRSDAARLACVACARVRVRWGRDYVRRANPRRYYVQRVRRGRDNVECARATADRVERARVGTATTSNARVQPPIASDVCVAIDDVQCA